MESSQTRSGLPAASGSSTVVMAWLKTEGDGTSITGAIPAPISTGAVVIPFARSRLSNRVSLVLAIAVAVVQHLVGCMRLEAATPNESEI